jgi:hypothetical protein
LTTSLRGSYGADFEPVYSGFAENCMDLKTLMVQISNQRNNPQSYTRFYLSSIAPVIPAYQAICWLHFALKIKKHPRLLGGVLYLINM